MENSTRHRDVNEILLVELHEAAAKNITPVTSPPYRTGCNDITYPDIKGHRYSNTQRYPDNRSQPPKYRCQRIEHEKNPAIDRIHDDSPITL
jgi:hypothetical protein